MPVLTIITINYNNYLGLEKTLISVCNQTFPDIEYVVIDGGSTDGSKELLSRYDPKISYWVSEKDDGIYHAMNKGIERATGEYLLFLNSGDALISPEVIQHFFVKSLQHDLVAGDLVLEKNNRDVLATNPDRADALHFWESTLLHPCTFIRKSLFEKYGKYDEQFPITADYHFFLKVRVIHDCSYEHRNIVVARFDTNGISSDEKNQSKIIEERNRAMRLYFSAAQEEAVRELFILKNSDPYRVWKWANKFVILRFILNGIVRMALLVRPKVQRF